MLKVSRRLKSADVIDGLNEVFGSAGQVSNCFPFTCKKLTKKTLIPSLAVIECEIKKK